MIISGKEISMKIKEQLKEEVAAIKENYSRLPKLVVILVGDNQASKTYVRNKERGCAYIGIESEVLKHDDTFSEAELLAEISRLNNDDSVDGILVQLPLPQHIEEEKVLKAIDPNKDVDGFHPQNVAKLFLGQQSLVPCTPKGMLVLLDEINYDLKESFLPKLTIQFSKNSHSHKLCVIFRITSRQLKCCRLSLIFRKD